MPLNIEIKAKIRDPQRQQALAAALATAPAEMLHQLDTFFCVPSGRLKLREMAPHRDELIFYDRQDLPGPKASSYSICQTETSDALRSLLAAALGVLGEVRKRRTVYLVGQTRIHVDEVKGLGAFLELEVVLRPGQSPDDGQRITAELMHQLGIDEGDLVPVAYIDLLMEREQR